MTEKTNDESQNVETEAKWGVDKKTNVEGPRYLWGSVSASLEWMGRYLTQVVSEMVAAESNTVLQCGYYVLSKKFGAGYVVSCDANFKVSLFSTSNVFSWPAQSCSGSQDHKSSEKRKEGR